jgi:hypothetical protein
MADQPFMYAIVVGAFAALTAILFGSRAKRRSEQSKTERANTERKERSPI